MKHRNLIALFISSVLAIVFYLLNPIGLEAGANKAVTVALLMIALWVSEALPMPVVALLPIVLFPFLGIAPIDITASSYANPVIFLFMGGFMLGLAIEKWNLHRRIALNIVKATGTSGDRIVLGFILATGFISMWLSNTATAMMMFPIALSVIAVIQESHPDKKGASQFSLSVMLAIALSANFGGIATIIGTPPNVAYAAFINKRYDYSIDFFKWMLLCFPIALALMFTLYWVMVKWLYPNYMKEDAVTKSIIDREVKALGPMSKAEKRVLTVFALTAFLWMSKGLLNKIEWISLDDNMIAIAGATLLFIVPSSVKGATSLLDWSDTKKMAWGILLLFGGGIALATSLERAGIMELMGTWFAQFAFNKLLLLLLVTTISIFISEVMSNVAQVIVFAPIVTSLAEATGHHPLELGIPMTLAASCASMLPMGTPPNAIAFSSGYIKLNQMIRVGFIMNIISIILITLFGWLLLPVLMQLN
ncbi:MAG: DASS family sodium-coupled anion symporter [Bacteroidota bacterium]|nr:DASS family sodium-coupled anion symporter [Bacteroidota bacterium]